MSGPSLRSEATVHVSYILQNINFASYTITLPVFNDKTNPITLEIVAPPWLCVWMSYKSERQVMYR